MTRWISLTAFIGSLAAAGACANGAQSKGEKSDAGAALSKLEGNWKLVRSEHKGNLRPGLDHMKAGLFIEDGKIFWTQDGKARGQKGDLTIDPSTSPKSIEVEITRGSFIGKKLLGIYELKGNKLTICWSEPGGEKRPTKFVTKTARGAGSVLETYQALDDEKTAVNANATDSKKGDSPADAAGDTKIFEGNWKLVRSESRGNLRPGLDHLKAGLFIEDGKISWTQDGKAHGQTGDLTIDPSTSPKSLEVEITRGSFIGKKLLAIYEFKGNKLIICWSAPGGEKRPTKFVTKTAVGAGATLETYEALDGEKVAAKENSADSKKAGGQVDAAADLKLLEGNWKLTRMEAKGSLRAGIDQSKNGLFIEDGKIFWTQDGKEAGGQKGDLTIDPSASPKAIDVEVTRGSLIGKIMLGIYEIKGKKLTICWGDPGGEKRPTKFVTKTAIGAGSFLETYQKMDD